MNPQANNMMGNMMQNMIGKTMQNNPIFAMLQSMRNGQNPMILAQQMSKNNPKMAQALNLIQGKSPQELEQTARNMAKEHGISLDQLAKQLGLNLPESK